MDNHVLLRVLRRQSVESMEVVCLGRDCVAILLRNYAAFISRLLTSPPIGGRVCSEGRVARVFSAAPK